MQVFLFLESKNNNSILIYMVDIDFKNQADEIGIDVNTLANLYRLFIEQTEIDIRQLEEAISIKEIRKVKEIGHSIKGSSLNLELIDFSNMAGDIEIFAEDEAWGKLAGILLKFCKSFNDLKSFLNEAVDEKT